MKSKIITRTDNRWDIYSNLAKGLKSKKAPLAPAALGSAFLLGLPMAGMAQEYCYQSVGATLTPDASTAFDFDQDGNQEMSIRIQTTNGTAAGIAIGGASGNFQFYKQTTIPYARPARLNTAQTITASNTNFVGVAGTAAFFTRNAGYYWANGTAAALTGYTTFIFQAFNGDQHLGWMQLEIDDYTPAAPHFVRIIDWAYNTIPIGQAGGNEIITGATSPTGACVILPVELTHFKAKAQKESIVLHWRTETEENNAGFELQRSENGKDFKTLAFIEGAGSTVEPQEYAFEDATARNRIEYLYRLKQIDFDGAFEYSEIITAGLESDKLEASEVFPNPVSDQAQINVTLPKEEQLTISIFDSTGKLIRHLEQQLGRGTHTLEWNMEELSSGIYFAKIATAKEQMYRKIIVR